MKPLRIALVAHGYPPELLGGTELSVQALARGLARRGHRVLVVAGTLAHEDGFRISEAEDEGVEVLRIHRDDAYFEHWQKSASVRVGEAFESILREREIELVHVHHWIRLTRDLVALAARAGVPAVVTLHDLWTSCLVSFRVPPGTDEFCEAPLAPHPCLACAERNPPRTPWVSMENRFLAIAERRTDLLRELELADRVLVPTRAHGEAVCRFLGTDPGALGLETLPHGRDLTPVPRAPRPGAGRDGRLVLGAWGHVHALKGQDLIVEAMRALAEPDRVTLHVAGGTPDPAFVERLESSAAGLDVHLHGPFSADEPGALARHPVTAVDAMISASRGHESWGLVVDEAAALGLPMILPRSGAFAERVTRGGFFFEPRDASSLAELLRELLEDPERLARARAELRGGVSLAPSVDEHVERLETIYAGAVARGAPAVEMEPWWRRRMRASWEAEWDASLGRRSAAELGFE